MSEKRFKKMDTIIDPFPIWDTVEEKGYNCTDTLDLLVDLLNELSDENEKLRFLIDINSVSERKKLERQVDEQQAIISQLKQEIGEWKKENRELLDQIQEFERIPKSIRELWVE